MGHLYCVLSSQGSGTIIEEGKERWQKPEVEDYYKSDVWPQQGKWTQQLHKWTHSSWDSMPEPSQATQEAHSERGGRLDIPFLAEKLLSSNSLWGGLFLRCGSWLVDQVPVDDHTFMNTWAVQFGHYGLTKENNERELSRQWTGVDLGGLGEGGKYDKKKHTV